jgi:hypothetical protein
VERLEESALFNMRE